MRRLPSDDYLSFPLRFGEGGAATSDRRAHVRELIVQALFTDPGERVFRAQFGAGVRRLTFEPNAQPLWELARKRVVSTLADALQGEVDPRTLEVGIEAGSEGSGYADGSLVVTISYQLSALGAIERQAFVLGREGAANG
jgi:phage baseplate assembly protein W